MNPKIIILDEPFSNLDYPGSKQILNQIIRLKQENHTIIVVTHDREVVRDVPNVLTLQDGLIEATPLEAAARRQAREQQALRMSEL